MRRMSKALVLMGVLTALSGLWAAPAWADGDTFMKGTRINGCDVGDMTVEQAKAALEDPDLYQLEIIRRKDKKDSIKGSEIGYQARVQDDLNATLAEQKAGSPVLGPGANIRFTAAVSVTYDPALLNEKIMGLDCISGGDIAPTSDAHISAYQEGQAFTIVKEVQGDQVDAEKTAQVIRDAVNAGQTSVNLEESGCYKQIAVRSTDSSLLQLLDVMNRCKDMVVTYTFGEATEELKGDVIMTWLLGSEGGQILVDREAAAQYVAGLAQRHDTAGTARVFHTITGRDVSVAGSYGWKIDQAAEIDALIALIQEAKSETREPVYAQAAATHDVMDWGNTYAEVDLTEQHVYMVQNGAVLWDSPCVTGLASDPDRVTPPGIFTISYKEKDRVLRGKKREDGTYEYESPVSYWMPFNGGIGFHDASWRGSFGGAIYKTSGSHGCVNLPPSKVPAFYEMVYQGMPVICYN